MNLLVLKQFELPLANSVFSSSARRPLSAWSVCHEVQMAERRRDARPSGGLDGRPLRTSARVTSGFSLASSAPLTQFNQIIDAAGVLLLPNLEDMRSDLWKSSGTSKSLSTNHQTLDSKVYKMIPVQSLHMYLASNLLHIISCGAPIDRHATIQTVSTGTSVKTDHGK